MFKVFKQKCLNKTIISQVTDFIIYNHNNNNNNDNKTIQPINALVESQN